MTARILVLPGSMRPDSPATRLAAAASLRLARDGADVMRISLQDYPLPICDEKPESIPANAVTLARMVAAHDGLVLVSPEINGSMAPLLKNAIDWIVLGSAGAKPAWPGRFVALTSACEAPYAGESGLLHLRSVMQALGAEVIAAQCLVHKASHGFDAGGELIAEAERESLSSVSRTLIRYCHALAPDRDTSRWEKPL